MVASHIPTHAVLVRTIATSAWTPTSGDPSGVAWHDDLGVFIVVDGEIEESVGGTTHYAGVNVWEMTAAGAITNTWTTTSDGPLDISHEPVGAAVDPATGHLFISDDSGQRAFEIDRGGDDTFGTNDDVIVRTLDLGPATSDPEGLAFGAGALWIADGVSQQVRAVNPTTGSLISSVNVQALGAKDPEGIEYDASTGRLFVVGAGQGVLLEMTTSGTACRTFDLLDVIGNPDPADVKLAGLALGPASAGGGTNLYVTDRGVDFNPATPPPDGKVYEIDIPRQAAAHHRRPPRPPRAPTAPTRRPRPPRRPPRPPRPPRRRRPRPRRRLPPRARRSPTSPAIRSRPISSGCTTPASPAAARPPPSARTPT